MRQTACIVFDSIMVEGYAELFGSVIVRASESMTALTCSFKYLFEAR